MEETWTEKFRNDGTKLVWRKVFSKYISSSSKHVCDEQTKKGTKQNKTNDNN